MLKSAVAESETVRATQAKDLDQARGLAAGAQLLPTPGAAPGSGQPDVQDRFQVSARLRVQTLTEGVHRRYRSMARQGGGADAETLVFPPSSAQVQTPKVPVNAPPVPGIDGLEPDATAVFIMPAPMAPATKTPTSTGGLPPAAPPPQSPPPQASMPPATAAPRPSRCSECIPGRQSSCPAGCTKAGCTEEACAAPAVLAQVRGRRCGADWVAAGAWLALRPKAPQVVATPAPTDVSLQFTPRRRTRPSCWETARSVRRIRNFNSRLGSTS